MSMLNDFIKLLEGHFDNKEQYEAPGPTVSMERP